MRLFIALTTFATLAACTPTGSGSGGGGGGYSGTPVAQTEGDFPGPSAQTRNRPLELPAGE